MSKQCIKSTIYKDSIFSVKRRERCSFIYAIIVLNKVILYCIKVSQLVTFRYNGPFIVAGNITLNLPQKRGVVSSDRGSDRRPSFPTKGDADSVCLQAARNDRFSSSLSGCLSLLQLEQTSSTHRSWYDEGGPFYSMSNFELVRFL